MIQIVAIGMGVFHCFRGLVRLLRAGVLHGYPDPTFTWQAGEGVVGATGLGYGL